MFTFDLTNLQRAIVSVAGALVFATVVITATVSPVEAAMLVSPIL
ncbi:hypothetical protein [Sphingomonas sp. SCN 67-18]|nr:hypothetical protein [Sphingomonas sp. SCN 67-18]